MNTFGGRLRLLREGRGLTRGQLAEQTGIPKNTYGNWETGKNEPSIVMAQSVADFFGVSLDWLCGRTDDRDVAKASELRTENERLRSLLRQIESLAKL
jgi:transcriptional regulator with XRE-family HTH domain